MAKPKRFSIGPHEIQYTSQRECKEKVFALAEDVFSRLGQDPVIVLRVPWNQGTNEYEGYIIQPAPDGWKVFKFGHRAKPRCIALMGKRSRDEVLYEYLTHEAGVWFDPAWDLDAYKRYRVAVEAWVTPYVGEGQAIVFSQELDKRRRDILDCIEERKRHI